MNGLRRRISTAAVGLALSLGVLFLLPSALPRAGAAASTAVCTFVRHDVLTPGLSLTPARGSGTGTGEIRCIGAIGGQVLSGQPGTLSVAFDYGTGDLSKLQGGDTCATASGAARWRATLPAAGGGTVTLEGGATFTAIGLVGEAQGTLGRSRFVSSEQFSPEPDHLDENCVTKPLVHYVAVGQMLITDS